ncbi:MOB kinase activator 2 isoform X1 [Lutra lutra]|uniref:MOB kinase activator 2 isoform X1 n=2 Tax=Lutra lutra TaxID=9657 RepID=UPI001FD17CFC|nr:MOB kinase activator 2 isoform X1 [Lutra lutra]
MPSGVLVVTPLYRRQEQAGAGRKLPEGLGGLGAGVQPGTAVLQPVQGPPVGFENSSREVTVAFRLGPGEMGRRHRTGKGVASLLRRRRACPRCSSGRAESEMPWCVWLLGQRSELGLGKPGRGEEGRVEGEEQVQGWAPRSRALGQEELWGSPWCVGAGLKGTGLSVASARAVLVKSKAKPNGKKPAAEEKKMYLEPEYTRSRITDVGFKELVVLPREIDLNEWLASNTTTFFHHVNLQYSTISEFCTGEACQTMAVCNTQYYWYDERGKKVKCTAPQYVDFVMSSVQKLVTDEDVFPTKYGREFPSSFEALVKKICKYLFHVLAHIYWSHFKETLALELHGHLNTLYAHFILFAREFNLLDPKETAVMDDLTEVLCSGGGRGGGGGAGASGGGAGAQNHGKER